MQEQQSYQEQKEPQIKTFNNKFQELAYRDRIAAQKIQQAMQEDFVAKQKQMKINKSRQKQKILIHQHSDCSPIAEITEPNSSRNPSFSMHDSQKYQDLRYLQINKQLQQRQQQQFNQKLRQQRQAQRIIKTSKSNFSSPGKAQFNKQLSKEQSYPDHRLNQSAQVVYSAQNEVQQRSLITEYQQQMINMNYPSTSKAKFTDYQILYPTAQQHQFLQSEQSNSKLRRINSQQFNQTPKKLKERIIDLILQGDSINTSIHSSNTKNNPNRAINNRTTCNSMRHQKQAIMHMSSFSADFPQQFVPNIYSGQQLQQKSNLRLNNQRNQQYIASPQTYKASLLNSYNPLSFSSSQSAKNYSNQLKNSRRNPSQPSSSAGQLNQTLIGSFNGTGRMQQNTFSPTENQNFLQTNRLPHNQYQEELIIQQNQLLPPPSAKMSALESRNSLGKTGRLSNFTYRSGTSSRMRSLPHSANKQNRSQSILSKVARRPPTYKLHSQQRKNITNYEDSAVKIDDLSNNNRSNYFIENDESGYYEPISQQMRLIRKKNNLPRFSQLGVLERNTLWQFARDAKIQRARDACKDIDLVGCTFHPKVKITNTNGTPRSSNNISAIGSSLSHQSRRLTSQERQILTHSNSYTQIHNIKTGRNNSSSFFSTSTRNDNSNNNHILTSNISSSNLSQNCEQTPKNSNQKRATGYFRVKKGDQYSLSEQRPIFYNQSPGSVTKKFLSNTTTASPRILLNSEKQQQQQYEIEQLNTFASRDRLKNFQRSQQIDEQKLYREQQQLINRNNSSLSEQSASKYLGMFYGGGGTGDFQTILQGSSGGGQVTYFNQQYNQQQPIILS